ncbi:MAG: hypothetical protein R2862_08415 [Thermoanaerobaculia bacterium]
MVRQRLVLGALSLTLALPLAAQLPPAATPGFKPEGVYDFKNIDQVALMNGALSIQIPIAGPYPVNGGLSWSLSLQYSNSAWEAYPTYCKGQICDGVVYPKPDRNAGLGWRVSLGELRKPKDSGANYVPRWIYSDPSGGEHVLYSTLHEGEAQDAGDPALPASVLEGVNYTRDGSYLRVKCLNYQSFGDCTVEFPNGDLHILHNYGTSTNPEYRLKEVQDQFANKVFVSYNSNNTQWTISQTGSSRVATVNFLTTGMPDQPRLVDSVSIPCFAGQCDGGSATHAVWNFAYSMQSIWRPAIFNATYGYPANYYVLTALTLPDGSSFAIPAASYLNAPNGEIHELQLPTGGKLQWDWATFEFPGIHTTQPCPQQIPPDANFWTSITGVSKRREYDRGGVPPLLGEWTYERSAYPAEPATAEKLTVTVKTPLKDRSEHYFSIYGAENGAVNCGTTTTPPIWGTSISEFAMPYTRSVPDSTLGMGVQRYLSSRTYDCDDQGNNCTLVRSVFQRSRTTAVHSPGGMAPLLTAIADSAQRVVYNDDGGQWQRRAMSNYDGVGHYRTAVSDGSFVSSHVRTETTNFNPARGTYRAATTLFLERRVASSRCSTAARNQRRESETAVRVQPLKPELRSSASTRRRAFSPDRDS